jgi:hypothetical protein
MAIDEKRKLRLLHSLDEILAQFRATNLPSPKDNSFRVFFPTPPDAIWGDVSICFKDGYTVSIKVKSANGVFNYTQMGMESKHNGNPTKRWNLLETLAKNKGILDWSSPEADKHLKKQKEQLSKSLRDFFRLEGDPIEWVKSEHNYRCRFRVCMEGSELSESALYFPGAIDYPSETRPRSKNLSDDDEAEY